MSDNVYVGRRYVPKFHTNEDGSSLWTSDKEYESLTIVTFEGNSYTSKKDVPSGVELTNTEYWVKSADYNEQLAVYRDEQVHLKNDFEGVKSDLEERMESVEGEVSSFTENINGKIKTYDISISELNTEVTNVISSVNTLDNKVISNTTSLNNIDNKINKVSNLSKIVDVANLVYFKNLPAKDTIWLQSFCINRTDNVMIACYSIDEVTSHIQKISLSDMSVLAEVSGLPYYHVNDVTYNSRTNEIIICPMSEPNAFNKLLILDYATLNKKREVFVGQDNANSIYGIAYDNVNDNYYVAMGGFKKLDSNFNIIKSFDLTYEYNNNIAQTMEYYKNMLFFQFNNKINVYDSNTGDFIKSISTNDNMESEGLAVLDEDTLLLGKIQPSYKASPKLFKINLFDSKPNTTIVYKNLEEIGITVDDKLTIKQICSKMENNSTVSFDVNMYSNATELHKELPNRYSCLEIHVVTQVRIIMWCYYWTEEKPKLYYSTFRTDEGEKPVFIEVGGNAITTEKATAEVGEQGTITYSRIKKRNGILNINFCVTGLTDFTGAKTVGVLPLGFRPLDYSRVDGFTTGNGTCRFEIATDGKISMKTTTLTSPTNTDWFEFNTTFIVT